MVDQNELYDELCLSIYNTNRYFHRLYGGVLAEYDLSYLQYMSLLIIYKNGSAKLMDIGNKLELSSNTLTPVIDRLVQKEWLIKIPNELDRRVKSLKIADSKKDIFEEILSDVAVIRDELIANSTSSVTEMIKENQALNETLQKMIATRNHRDD